MEGTEHLPKNFWEASHEAQIRIEAMLLTSLSLQAEIIAHQQGKDFDTVHQAIAEKVKGNTEHIVKVLNY